MGKVFFDLRTLKVKLIRQAFQEQHAEDKFFVFRGIHLAAQDVG
jgi:hypothetical protein